MGLFGFSSKKGNSGSDSILDIRAKLLALNISQAVIEFNMDGTILTANENFLKTVGYSLAEIQGKHHRIFVKPEYALSAEYLQFWESLNRGEYQAAEYNRIKKDGEEVWLEANYNPLIGADGQPYKVIKFATDITSKKIENINFLGQIEAINRSQAVIEFKLDGTILEANNNFLGLLNYSLAEVQGRHHSIFVDPEYKKSIEYAQFWEALNRGEYQSAEFKRFGKEGKEVWIQATYSPIMGLDGKPFKVVKFATDVTSKTLAKETVREMVLTTTSGSEEMSVSIREIAEIMEKSKVLTDTASTQTLTASEEAKNLADASDAMGGIVELINRIAEKINLLSLNATIEAARAGEAGRGFAVVAKEVKDLAAQASDATSQISTRIDSMQEVSSKVMESLNKIKESIGSVQDGVTSTATAVNEQDVVSNEISVSMQKINTAMAAV